MSRAEERGDGRRGVGAHQPVDAAMADAHFGEAVEVAQEVFPFEREAGLTLAWLGRCRRLVKDWECLNRKARLMLRKLCNPI